MFLITQHVFILCFVDENKNNDTVLSIASAKVWKFLPLEWPALTKSDSGIVQWPSRFVDVPARQDQISRLLGRVQALWVLFLSFLSSSVGYELCVVILQE